MDILLFFIGNYLGTLKTVMSNDCQTTQLNIYLCVYTELPDSVWVFR